MSLVGTLRRLIAQSQKSSNQRKSNILPKSEKHQVSHSWHNSNLRPESIILALAHLPLVVKMVLLQHYHLMIQVDPSQAQVATQTAQAQSPQSPHQAVLVAQVVAAVTHLVVAALLLRLAVVALVAVVVEVVDLVMEAVTRYFYLSRPPRQKNTPNFFSGSRGTGSQFRFR